MVRSFLTVFGATASACAVGGCSGQNVQGNWRGSFPLEGVTTCEIRLPESSNFTIACKGADLVGGGHYRWDGQTLTLSVDALTRDGKLTQGKPEFEFQVKGSGNSMTLMRNHERYVWQRYFGR